MSLDADVGAAPSLPRGNVRLTLGTAATDSGEDHDTGTGWSVHDGHGEVVLAGLCSRSEAIRTLGALALKGAELPLQVHRPDGTATGERLA